MAILWAIKRARNKNLSRYTTLDISLGIMFGALLGARLFHVFYEQPSDYLADPLRIFMIWQGGFVFYGGAIGGFLGGFIVLKIKGERWRMWADFVAPIGAFGYGLGRMACFLNGCCHGKVCALPWAVRFPGIEGGRHPTQLYAAFLEWGICLFLLLLEKRKGLKECVNEIFSGDSRGGSSGDSRGDSSGDSCGDSSGDSCGGSKQCLNVTILAPLFNCQPLG